MSKVGNGWKWVPENSWKGVGPKIGHSTFEAWHVHAVLVLGNPRSRGAMDDKDIQLAKVVELFTKFSKDGWRLRGVQ